MGYALAGFEVVGVDIKPQPHYPFEFQQMDALEVLSNPWPWEDDIDAIHASPPCQRRAAVTAWRGRRDDHPDLVTPTLALLRAQELPWVVENVPGEYLGHHFQLCGSMFGLPIRRHRWFVTSWSGFEMMSPCHHQRADMSFDHGGKQPESAYRDTMGCGWMTVEESRQAIPPAYTAWIGRRLMAEVQEPSTKALTI